MVAHTDILNHESRTQGTQSAYIGQNNTEKIYIKQHETLR